MPLGRAEFNDRWGRGVSEKAMLNYRLADFFFFKHVFLEYIAGWFVFLIDFYL